MNSILSITPGILWPFMQNLSAKRIQIITSCEKPKTIRHQESLTWRDFEQGMQHLRSRERALGTVPARELYNGRQHSTLLEGIATRPDLEVDLKIVSAGYGLISGDQLVAPYEATFAELPKEESVERGEILGIPSAMREALERTDCDLTMVILGEDYLRACSIRSPLLAPCPTIFIGGKFNPDTFHGSNCFQVPLSNYDPTAPGAGQAWLKSEVASRALKALAA